MRTLTRGRALLERTIGKLEFSKFLPGDVAWRLYDTYGFPLDLTQLMCEEKSLSVDLEGYEEAKKRAVMISQGKMGGDEGVGLGLDVHSIGELQGRGVQRTEDQGKYLYQVGEGGGEEYGEFMVC